MRVNLRLIPWSRVIVLKILVYHEQMYDRWKEYRSICFSYWKASFYLDLVHVSGLFWQKSIPDIDHWNEIKDVGLMLSKKE
jgi:hypothetical protein